MAVSSFQELADIVQALGGIPENSQTNRALAVQINSVNRGGSYERALRFAVQIIEQHFGGGIEALRSRAVANSGKLIYSREVKVDKAEPQQPAVKYIDLSKAQTPAPLPENALLLVDCLNCKKPVYAKVNQTGPFYCDTCFSSAQKQLQKANDEWQKFVQQEDSYYQHPLNKQRIIEFIQADQRLTFDLAGFKIAFVALDEQEALLRKLSPSDVAKMDSATYEARLRIDENMGGVNFSQVKTHANPSQPTDAAIDERRANKRAAWESASESDYRKKVGARSCLQENTYKS